MSHSIANTNPAPEPLIDLLALAQAAQSSGPVWSLTSAQLNMNILRFTQGDGVPEHVNSEVDVLGVVITGSALVRVDGGEHHVQAGQAFFIPCGAQRSISATSPTLAYLSCHQRRAGLQPTVTRRSERATEH